MKIRTFLALEIPDYIKDRIFDLLDSISKNRRFSWEPKNKIHLTLKFFGEIDDNLIKPIVEKLDFLNNLSVQTMEITKFDFFFYQNQPKIFFAGLKFSSELINIVDKIENSLNEFGIEKEKRKFHPHLTLLRIKNNFRSDFLTNIKNLNFEPIIFQAEQIVLYKSDLHPSGSIYKPLHKFQLKKWSYNVNRKRTKT